MKTFLQNTDDAVQKFDGIIYWNAWNDNTYSRGEDGYIIHALADDGTGSHNSKTLCGVMTNDGGLLVIPTETIPGCKRCKAILIKRGVIKPEQN